MNNYLQTDSRRSVKSLIIQFVNFCLEHKGNIEKIIFSKSFYLHLIRLDDYFQMLINGKIENSNISYSIDDSLESIDCTYEIHLKEGDSPIRALLLKRK
jgi:hypothetical protein